MTKHFLEFDSEKEQSHFNKLVIGNIEDLYKRTKMLENLIIFSLSMSTGLFISQIMDLYSK